MKQFFSFVLKEAKHIFRDKRTMLMLFGMPIMLMLLFGFAVTNDVRNVRTIIVASSMDYATRQATNRLAASEYFTISAQVSTPAEAEREIRAQRADMAVVFSPQFAMKHGKVQFIVDASDPNQSQQWTNYATQVLFNPAQSLVNIKLIYNPQMRSAYNFVPAIHHGNAFDAHLCNDDFYFDSSRKRERDNGNLIGVTHQTATHHPCESSAVSCCLCIYISDNSFAFCLCFSSTYCWLFVVDLFSFGHLHIVSPFFGIVGV